ncbi:MAG: methyltransferase domain-containing protein [candidate division SR1 bacterium]|nr:methyltransferase domain-containing protein [candidate division SR1 bacterium]
MGIKEGLRAFYDAQAEKYYHTRNKHRSDADIFLDEIQTSEEKTINILEFGCGSGRLLAHLAQLKDIKINYVGVDISKNLLSFAKKQISGKAAPKNITTTFVCDDIVHYVKGLKQESFDFVIGVASFQHIPNIKERFFVMKNVYRILKYDGKLIMTNWSFSRWFLRKFQKDFSHSLGKYIISFGKDEWNSIMVPRKNGKTIDKRFYHIYTLAELKKLASLSGFIIETLSYLAKGTLLSSRKQSQNSLIIAKKTVFLKTE